MEIQAASQMVLDSIMNRNSRDAVGRGRHTGPGTYSPKGVYFEGGKKLTCNKGKANTVILPQSKYFWLTTWMYTYIHTYFPQEKNQILNEDSVDCCVWCTYTVEFQYKIPIFRLIFCGPGQNPYKQWKICLDLFPHLRLIICGPGQNPI